MTRNVKEWVAKNDNVMPPASVRQRILERDNHTCHICKGEIQPGQKWIPDHVPPLKDGGENRETKIKAAHEKCHRLLTAQQATERAPIERKKQKHYGSTPPPKQKMESRGFEKKERKPKPSLPPRRLFE